MAKVKPTAIVKKEAATPRLKNPNGSYTLHMHDKLAWLHDQAGRRGMQTSVFVRECIDSFIKSNPVRANKKTV